MKKKSWLGEDWRQLVHIAFGAVVMVSLLFLGRDLTLTGLLLLLCIEIVFSSWKMLGYANPLFDFVIQKFERNVDIPGKGALMYIVGVLFLVAFSFSFGLSMAGLAILAFGDGVATMAGVRGKKKLFWNRKKSWEGLLAFIVASSIVAFPFIGILGIVYSIILGVVESLPIGLDDNVVIPVGAVLLKLVLG